MKGGQQKSKKSKKALDKTCFECYLLINKKSRKAKKKKGELKKWKNFLKTRVCAY
jgi:hypothetical protein